LNNTIKKAIKQAEPETSPIKNLAATRTVRSTPLIIDRTKFVKMALNKAEMIITNIRNL